MNKKFDEEDFLKMYRGSEKFVVEGAVYYKAFLRLLDNESLLDKIKFANDYLKEPPLKTFILYDRENNPDSIFVKEMSVYEKQGIGACFGYLYRFMYGDYEPKQCLFNDKMTGIKTVSRFEKRK